MEAKNFSTPAAWGGGGKERPEEGDQQSDFGELKLMGDMGRQHTFGRHLCQFAFSSERYELNVKCRIGLMFFTNG